MTITEWVTSLSDKLGPALEGSPLIALGVAFVGGVLVSLTPCVYPVIPIIVGFVGGVREKSRFRAFLLSLLYVVGMALTFAALGAIVALAGRGIWRPSAVLYIVVGNVIIVFALSLLGVFTIPLPGFLGGGASPRKGLLGALVMGAASGLVTVPCTTAVLTGVLAVAAQRQSVVFGFLLLLCFALGLGVLLVLIGTFSGILAALPKPGRWMEVVEKAFGVGMIALGEYFLIKGGELLV
jgi:cytochrome c-type biogenesis protein